jgi:hypothetical protein
VCARGAVRAASRGRSTSPLEGLVGETLKAGASTSFDLEDPSLPRRVGKAIRFLDLTQCPSWRDVQRWRAATEAVGSASAASVSALRLAAELRAGAR